MTQQLIVTILGAEEFGVLSTLAETVCEAGCNILDSRQAVYGQSFSLTMIIEGSHCAITQAEIAIPITCQKHNLLSMMKRTKKHCKQNLETLADVIIIGIYDVAIIREVTQFFAEHQISVSAFRLKSIEQDPIKTALMTCKMVISMPHSAGVVKVNTHFQAMLEQLKLTGSIIQNH
ncbi:MAG: glycine cleavage system transcriptional repressor [Paraglaciecola sp.]|jgi:glycine cleavage system transcriptional repressor